MDDLAQWIAYFGFWATGILMGLGLGLMEK